LNKEYSRSGDFVQACIEFSGEGIRGLSLDDRQTILAGMYHCGADTAIMEIDEKVIEYVEARSGGRPYERITADDGATYRMSTRVDLSELHPYVTLPPRHDQVVELPEVAGKAVTHSMIGSCGNNRIEDLRAAAEILQGRVINRNVTMYITPGSPEIYSQAASEGLLKTFVDAGASVLTPSCSTCWGYLGALSDGDVAITTHQEHYKGRMGSRDAEVLISGPYVAAAAAVAGQLVDPREFLQGRS
jgi:3-isopropylmalate/(R)-2-methylmalate dehydratase large subunit